MNSWNDAVGELISAIGTPGMPARLADTLRRIAAIDYIVMFGYRDTSKPLHLFDDFTPSRRRLHVDEYLEGPYLLDPFFMASQPPGRLGLFRISDIAPDRFAQAEYYCSYYKQTGLAEEIGFLVKVNSAFVVVVSLMRRKKRFSKTEFSRFADARPIVDAACRQQWRALAPARDAADGSVCNATPVDTSEAFRRIGAGVLTLRESEIARLTLQGHSATAIGASSAAGSSALAFLAGLRERLALE